jgi:hypothetical protein
VALAIEQVLAEPFDFEEAYARALRVPLDTITATVVGLQDLIALKEASGRPVDAADVDALRALSDGGGRS